MNKLPDSYLRILEEYQDLKDELLLILTDEDLTHTLPGNPSLGELCKEFGETEQSYLNSFKTHKLNFEYKHPDATMASSVAALAAWYAELDAEFKTVLEAFSDEDFENLRINRGTWPVPIRQNLDIYKEALLIFAGKAWVYLNSLGKPMPEQWAEWIT
jgi:hypothetical protein